MELGMLLLLSLFIIPIFILPSIIATSKNHPHKIPIILINIIGGMFFGIGWLVSLVWCFIIPNEDNKPQSNAASEIEKLHELLQKGILTQEEFDSKKKTLLNT